MDSKLTKTSVALLSVGSNTILVIFKLIIGIAIGSVSVISEAIHSGVDLIAAIIAWWAVRKSQHPEDEEHPFGHGKYENISGTVEALLIFGAAVWIIWEAVHKILLKSPIEAPALGVAIMFISAAANIMVSRLLFAVGKRTDSVALLADAWHLRTDVWTSFGVMSGLGVIWIGKGILPETSLDYIDPIAAIIVALLILRAAYKLTIESARDLLDVSLPKEEEKWIRSYLHEFHKRGCNYHRLRTRKAGSVRFIDFHLLVQPSLSVGDSHGICDEMTSDLKKHFSNETSVTIHVEPITKNDGTPRHVSATSDISSDTSE